MIRISYFSYKELITNDPNHPSVSQLFSHWKPTGKPSKLWNARDETQGQSPKTAKKAKIVQTLQK